MGLLVAIIFMLSYALVVFLAIYSIHRLFYKRKLKRDQIEDIEELFDYELDKETKIRKRNHALFEKIVGESPIDQIDYIIRHGLNKYHHWFMCYENGTIYQPATVEQAVKPYARLFETYETTYVRGGIGNAKLIGWEVRREIQDEI